MKKKRHVLLNLFFHTLLTYLQKKRFFPIKLYPIFYSINIAFVLQI